MSYPGIVRKCSVCQCCGMCDWEHEAEAGDFSGDYNPVAASLMRKETNRQERERLIAELMEGGGQGDS